MIMNPALTLPNEIWDRVIDFHFDDKDTLQAISLVCKAFVPSSQHHLFYHLQLGALTTDWNDDDEEGLRLFARNISKIRTLDINWKTHDAEDRYYPFLPIVSERTGVRFSSLQEITHYKFHHFVFVENSWKFPLSTALLGVGGEHTVTQLGQG